MGSMNQETPFEYHLDGCPGGHPKEAALKSGHIKRRKGKEITKVEPRALVASLQDGLRDTSPWWLRHCKAPLTLTEAGRCDQIE